MSKNVKTQITETQKKPVLTPAQERLFGFIVSQCMKNGSVRLTKNELAKHMECCVRTIDRAVRKLRDEGYIEVVVLYGEDGDQICNEYRLAEHRS